MVASPQISRDRIQPCSAYFYLIEDQFPHLAIGLAEGLKALNIPVYANCNYWLLSTEPGDYLFIHDSQVNPEDCLLVILDKNWVFAQRPFPELICNRYRHHINIYLDDMDGPDASLWPPTIAHFDVILRTHCHHQTQYPSNFIPWAFGLSHRIVTEVQTIPTFDQRQYSLLFNFRVDQKELFTSYPINAVEQGFATTHTHQGERFKVQADYPVRIVTNQQFIPLIEKILPVDQKVDARHNSPSDPYHYLQWKQTGRRHYPQYYQRLKSQVACAAFAGWYIPALKKRSPYIEWWDSWRFWESLAAGCVTFHVDLDRYAVSLPVMPENWTHYIGIDMENMQDTVDRIRSEPTVLEKISQAGRQWVLEHYAPIPTALRFLKLLGFKSTEELLPFELRELNLIAFPDWLQPEAQLVQDLGNLLQRVLNYGDSHRIALLIDINKTTAEEANEILAQITFQLLMLGEIEEMEEDNAPDIIFLESLSTSQWHVLQYQLQARIALENENQDALVNAKLQHLPLF
ncbi:glycosyltransferase [Roseofilum reptotaenium CS-1145]|uniref:Uncharacterized protein n=1 Tax=Roseofilum reptotaenium AO1-A TaxID=1925591 RepID=A0A1L9QVF3_9CYAN|nr:glycosyltransferase [Roseofilum reptotaenium]MDB9518817.1 glycosyltransferase [Roseofilum reptotaenium CS-1145]OJJ26602.1 hypothetical protein BI308_05795 [Roseofilum reptotaenium AO1-A]